MISRRQAITSTLFGSGYIGLRALATGLPASFLLNPRRALAASPQPGCATQSKAQYIIMNTSGNGDPINANVPGTYDDPNVVHSTDVTMAKTAITMRGKSSMAAAPWATLPQAVLDRTVFWHLMTNTPIHPKEPEVLKLMGSTYAGEMLPSLLAKHLAPCLNTIQTQPISIGASTPAEGLSFGGAAQPIIPALALKATLTTTPGPLANLQGLRDQTLASIYDLYKQDASPAQKAYIDSLVTSQTQVRSINQNLLNALTSITDNTANSQILAAVTLIQMNVTPVIAVHIPFGGDNHRDVGLAGETTQTVSGVATINMLMSQLAAAGLSDSVSFMSLNVFGRTIGPGNTDGRQHNQNHQVSITIGKPFAGGVIGAIAPLMGDYGALPINSTTGAGSADGDIAPVLSLPSFGRTMLAAVGVDNTTIGGEIMNGKVITAALAS